MSFASGAVSGTIITALCRCEAQMPARDEPALPVEAATMVPSRFSAAKADTSAEALSLNDQVGFCESSLR
ncbi:MAG: hypothetical protein MZV63_49160 [Marinilabiliales bacterium]|nr:hypothetical protein [Marinilabiliales bacterium]